MQQASSEGEKVAEVRGISSIEKRQAHLQLTVLRPRTVVPTFPRRPKKWRAAARRRGRSRTTKESSSEVDAVEPPPKEGKPVGAAPKLVLRVAEPTEHDGAPSSCERKRRKFDLPLLLLLFWFLILSGRAGR